MLVGMSRDDIARLREATSLGKSSPSVEGLPGVFPVINLALHIFCRTGNARISKFPYHENIIAH